MSKENMTLDEYKEELYPRMYSNINLLFPDMNFREKGSKLVSRHHLDGQRDGQGKEITTISSSRPYAVNDLSRQGEGAKNLIEWYRERNSLDFYTALDRIADICGVDKFPRSTQSDKDKEIQENRENALDLFIRNLWSDREEALKVREYLHSRKWTDEEIKSANLGLITPDLRTQLPDADYYFNSGKSIPNVEVGKTHLLTIPFRSGYILKGFKFREIGVSTSTKYINSFGLKKGEGLFGLTLGQRDIVVVEGELDALHAQVKGANNVAATTGGGLTEGQIRHAQTRGVSRFNLLFDMDERGQAFIKSSLDTLDRMGAETYITYLPDGYKDTDEYLRDHTIEEWKSIVGQATHSYAYRYEKIIEKYIERQRGQDGQLFEKDSQDLLSELDALLTSPFLSRYTWHRKRIMSRMEEDLKDFNLDMALFSEYLDAKAERERQEKKLRDLKEKSSRISGLLESGKTDEALSLMKETADAEEEDSVSANLSLLLNDDIDETLSSMRGKTKGILTRFILGKEGYNFYLPAGSITLIGAPTGHGKSKMLMSLALDAISDLSDGTLLYVTYEENKESVTRQMINAYANIDLTAQTAKHGNLQTITEYFSTGSTQYMRGTSIESFKEKVEDFKRIYREGRIKIIRPTDNYSTTLCSLIRSAVSYTGRIKGIFIDYAQELYLPDSKAKIRTDELKQIMVSLDQIAQETNLPIVMGAQLKRDISSPLYMTNQDFLDSTWIANKASEVLLLWSNKEKCKGSGAEKYNKEVEKELPDLMLGTGGKIYAVLTKSRQTQTGIYSIFDINGNTGRIKGNKREEIKPDSYDPFPPAYDEVSPF